METVLAAVADPQRRALLDALRTGPLAVNELAEVVPIAQSGVSRHLRILRETGLVESTVDSQRRIYRLRPERLEELDAWLAPFRALWTQRLDALHTEIARGRHHDKEHP